jgi:LEA14-like dessication related protein
MTGDDEDAINIADEDAVHITVAEEETEKKSKTPQKKMKKPRKLWILLALIFIVIIIVVPIAATFQMPTVNVVGAEIRASGTGLQKTYKLYATVEVYNPNMVGCTIERISGTYYVNGANGGKFDEPNQVSIAAASTTTLNIQVIPTSPVPIHTTNTVEVKGTVTIQGAFTTWDVPFDETRDVPIT